jgi:hypothetical protein
MSHDDFVIVVCVVALVFAAVVMGGWAWLTIWHERLAREQMRNDTATIERLGAELAKRGVKPLTQGAYEWIPNETVGTSTTLLPEREMEVRSDIATELP